ncbi:MAG: DUF503 domain-containing protein [Spirochaetia bacterium]|jgi:uncharacterized protein YlxP (DUF503 family)|nr:DUF503 domain-containing protein [Spirochaetia bacterium]
MVVSLIQFIIYLPDATNLKEKRRVVQSLKQRLHSKFKISAAEVDLHESTTFSQIGAGLVSNSKKYGDEVIQKVILFVEQEVPGRVQDIVTHTEFYS